MHLANLSTEGLALSSARRPWLTVGAWVAALILAIVVIAALLGDALTTDDYFTNDPESDRAEDLLRERGIEGDPRATSEIVILRSDTLRVDDPRYQDFVETLFADLEALSAAGKRPKGEEHPVVVTNYYQTLDESLVSADRRTTIIPFDHVHDIDLVQSTVARADKANDFQVLITGKESFDKDFEEIAQEDLGIEFMVGIPAAIMIMIVVFGALLVTVVPVMLALVSIVMAVAITALVGQVWEFSFFVTNVIAMIGLAVGVDYSLFIVSRYREERSRGLDKMDAISVAAPTAGRAVFFSGMTVVVALIGMLLIPYSIFRSVAAGAIFVTLMAVLASLTLLPAVLSIMGDKVNSLRVPLIGFKEGSGQSEGGGFWDLAARVVMKRPVVSLLVCAAIMIAAAAPYFNINLGFPSIGTFPEDAISKQGFDVLEEDFSFGLVEPTHIVVDGDVESEAVRDAIQSLQQRLGADDSFNDSDVVFLPEKRLAIIATRMDGDPAAEETVAAMRRLRDEYIPETFAGVPAKVLTTGETASNVDFFDLADTYLPIVVGFVLAVSFVLLTVVFRSLVVPIKAIIMNLLSVGAAYGLMVLVFQHGVGADLFGFQKADSIAAWVPLYLFAVLFGLSMDYHVFLLSRIRERFAQTQDNTESVAYGLRSTGALITGAALIMIAVFSGFAMGPASHVPADGLRAGGCGLAGRDYRPVGPGAGDHEASWNAQLVAPFGAALDSGNTV